MKNTNTAAFRATVFRCILDSVPDFEGTDKDRAAHIWQRFTSEYDYPDNRRRIPNLQARVADWLAGLPLHIPFTYGDIIATSERWHECTFTDTQADMIIERWFSFMAQKLLQCVQAHGVDIQGNY